MAVSDFLNPFSYIYPVDKPISTYLYKLVASSEFLTWATTRTVTHSNRKRKQLKPGSDEVKSNFFEGGLMDEIKWPRLFFGDLFG